MSGRDGRTGTVFGVGIASFFGDLGYEAVTVLLPSFLIILGAPV